jgi:hypothetical protein
MQEGVPMTSQSANFSVASLQSRTLEFGRFCRIAFQRTLRIPDDGREYPLPPGMGKFPVVPVDRFADRVPEDWRRHGGVFIPMHQREALWIDFTGSSHDVPTAVKVGIGKVNALTGEAWTDRLQAGARELKQDYLVVPKQPWLDGINVGNGRIRQFVAVPLGSDYTVEGQVTGEETWGGIQILVVPAKPRPPVEPVRSGASLLFRRERARPAPDSAAGAEMGLGAGGVMRQRIYADPYGLDSWDQDNARRLFVHIANAEMFTEITGVAPPPTPVTAKSYTDAGLPWFDLYDADKQYLGGSEVLEDVWSLEELDEAKIGLAAVKDPGLDVGGTQVVKLDGDGRRIRDGDW